MGARKHIYVSVSLDVEEEGLFGGHYECLRPQTCNVAALTRLRPFLEKGVKPTLFCAYSMLSSTLGRQTLLDLRDDVEIGAHLHHWNTPPLAQNIPASGVLDSVPSNQVSLSLMKSKLKALIELCQRTFNRPVTSFRMGRWDLYSSFLPLLVKYGIKCDASVRPMHMASHPMYGPDHFSAPTDPYWIPLPNGRLLEVPLTVVPLLPMMKKLAPSFAKLRGIGASIHKWGAISLLPVQHPQWLMRFTAMRHIRNGGKVLSITWHSSEMMPGATPHIASARAVDALLRKIMRYLAWLEKTYSVEYVYVGELARIGGFGQAPPAQAADWHWHPEERDVY